VPVAYPQLDVDSLLLNVAEAAQNADEIKFFEKIINDANPIAVVGVPGARKTSMMTRLYMVWGAENTVGAAYNSAAAANLRGKGLHRSFTFHSWAMSGLRGTVKHIGSQTRSQLESIDLDESDVFNGDDDDDTDVDQALLFHAKVPALINSFYPPPDGLRPLKEDESGTALLSTETVLFGVAAARLYELGLQHGFGLEDSQHNGDLYTESAWRTLAQTFCVYEGIEEIYQNGLSKEQRARADVVYPFREQRVQKLLDITMMVVDASAELIMTGKVEGVDKLFYISHDLKEKPLYHNRMSFTECLYFCVKWRLQMLSRYAARVGVDEAQDMTILMWCFVVHMRRMSDALRPMTAPFTVIDVFLDPDQAINAFRGAMTDALSVIKMLSPQLQVYTFDTTYRLCKSHIAELKAHVAQYRPSFADADGNVIDIQPCDNARDGTFARDVTLNELNAAKSTGIISRNNREKRKVFYALATRNYDVSMKVGVGVKSLKSMLLEKAKTLDDGNATSYAQILQYVGNATGNTIKAVFKGVVERLGADYLTSLGKSALLKIGEAIGEMYSESPKITCVTGHGAKGLEWDVVYLINFGSLPSRKKLEAAPSQPYLLAQEHRLMYVMLSRSRDELYLCAEPPPEKPDALIAVLFPDKVALAATQERASKRARRTFQAIAAASAPAMPATVGPDDKIMAALRVLKALAMPTTMAELTVLEAEATGSGELEQLDAVKIIRAAYMAM